MKKLILSVTAIAGFSMASFAQGTITFDSSSSANVVSILGVVDTTQDINAELLYSSTGAAGTFSPVVTLLLGGSPTTGPGLGQIGYATGDITDNSNGTIYSDQGASFIIPNIAGSTAAFFEVEGWLGSANSLAGAVAAGAPSGTSAVFSEVLSSASSPTQASLDVMPSLNLVAVPEPSTLAMAGVGLASMLFFRRKNK
jgi:hypothetical protein